MFCKNCGTQLVDGAMFCANCGTATANSVPPAQPAAPVAAPVQPVAPAQPAAPVAAPVQPAAPAQPVYAPAPAPVRQSQPNPMFTKFVSVITRVWKTPTTVVGDAAKSNTHEWSLFAAIGVVLYALSNAIVGLESFVGYSYPFFGMLGIGLLVGTAAYGLTALGVWLLVAQIFKKQATFIQSLNMTAVAFLPLAAIQVVNMLAGLVYSPLTTMFTVSALVMTAILVYIGIQKFEKLEKSPYYAYCILAAAVVFSVSLLSLLYDEVLSTNVFSSMMNGWF